MRKWHRRLAAITGIFLFWIAMTGLGTHIIELQMESRAGNGPAVVPERKRMAARHEPATPIDPQAAGAPASFACPEGWTCRPPQPKDGTRRSA